jgi:hypothetical protein
MAFTDTLPMSVRREQAGSKQDDAQSPFGHAIPSLQGRTLPQSPFVEPPGLPGKDAEEEQASNKDVDELLELEAPEPEDPDFDKPQTPPRSWQPTSKAPKADSSNSAAKQPNCPQLVPGGSVDASDEGGKKTHADSQSKVDGAGKHVQAGGQHKAPGGTVRGGSAEIEVQRHLEQEATCSVNSPGWMDATMGDLSHSMVASAGHSSMHGLTSTTGSSTAGKSSVFNLTNPSAVCSLQSGVDEAPLGTFEVIVT